MKHEQILVLTKDAQIPDVINYGPKKKERGDGIEKGTGDKIQNQPEETYGVWGRVRGNGHGDNSCFWFPKNVTYKSIWTILCLSVLRNHWDPC